MSFLRVTYLPLILTICCTYVLSGQQTAAEVLAKSQAFHDPDGLWGKTPLEFTVALSAPGMDKRTSTITIDPKMNYFKLYEERSGDSKTYLINNAACFLMFNGSEEFSEQVAEDHRLTCERATMLRNYYTYLYGLPMKLNDPGTHIEPKLFRKRFKGKEYLVIKASYDPEVGKDTWYFYFNPQTYAMEVYQFFHNEAENDGEYILLKDIVEISGMRLPKTRTWYTNKEDKLLGTDDLVEK